MTDLGWLNDKHDEGVINEWVKRCREQGHNRMDEAGGSSHYAGWHIITCHDCGYTYQMDSTG